MARALQPCGTALPRTPEPGTGLTLTRGQSLPQGHAGHVVAPRSIQRERRFVAIDNDGESVGLVELIELDYIHRRGEFQIIIARQAQGRGYASIATRLAINYAFSVLNLRKIYLIVDKSNAAAIHVYEKCGFGHEAELIEEFFGNGKYHNAFRMCLFQREFFAANPRNN